MKKKVTFLMLTLVAMVASISFTSCDKDDEPTYTDNYYLTLSNVVTNCIDANGESIAPALKEAWISDFNANSNGQFSIGKTSKEEAIKAFDQSISNIKDAYNATYKGTNLLPEGGYFDLYFTLTSSSSSSSIRSATVRVSNSGATSN